MTKKIAVINDLSGFGRCSLVAAISVISAMGVQPCPLPTAILSAQTGYPSYFYDNYTERMEEIRREWKKMEPHFDGIYTGFMADRKQIGQTEKVLDTFCGKKTFLLVDPILGDEGRRFGMCTPEFLSAMRELVFRADIITPNLTELCLLTDTDYRLINQMTDEKHMLTIVEQMAKNVMAKGPSEIVVTGVRYRDAGDGEEKIGNLAVKKNKTTFSAFSFVGESFSGTGDLFASVIAGAKARGDSLEASIDLAGRMIEQAMRDSAAENVPRNEGVEYEKYLWMLTGKERNS
ncbi:pyridoxine kinase [Lachnoclostridium sp. An169]|uniref:pyridoxamine kinase n=1 Tax=Lachnoclostridium sp. An169 TaxID=1965569 RepID=UPI000B38DB00|nr:pyridoxamine kinase [Lachnoclostridium sp. An169]OUP84649.1 pyridoxine kinase [Lachnoclostridium sp. An169]HJA66117.1 pyridoxamine kinase [Candidatus Mediterraneibacter cottocaccae]